MSLPGECKANKDARQIYRNVPGPGIARIQTGDCIDVRITGSDACNPAGMRVN